MDMYLDHIDLVEIDPLCFVLKEAWCRSGCQRSGLKVIIVSSKDEQARPEGMAGGDAARRMIRGLHINSTTKEIVEVRLPEFARDLGRKFGGTLVRAGTLPNANNCT
jgi:hypothetical protein